MRWGRLGAAFAGLVARRMRGGLLIGILFTTVLSIVINEIWGNSAIWESVGPGVGQVPDEVVSTPNFDLLGNFSITGVFDVVPFLTAVALILSVMRRISSTRWGP